MSSTAVTSTYTVTGMSCEHCARAVTEEVSAIVGVHDVEVDLASGRVSVTSERELTQSEVAEAVDEAGYQLA
jgi:copper chaperone CopZ